MSIQEAISLMQFKNLFNNEDACRENISLKYAGQTVLNALNVVMRLIMLSQQETGMNAQLVHYGQPSSCSTESVRFGFVPISSNAYCSYNHLKEEGFKLGSNILSQKNIKNN